jgi:ubiquitin-activating enzyme E1
MLTLIFRYFRAPVEHVAFRALDVFRAKNEGRLPTPGSEADATDLLGIATEINTTAKAAADAEEAAQKAAAAAAEAAGTEPAKNPPRIHAVEDLDEAAQNLVRAFARGAQGELPTMTAFLGGVVGQEILKACSGKFTPIGQWLYFDAFECLSDPLPSEADCAPQGNRYDRQVAVFGKTFHDKTRESSFFLVGAGAIGCEMLKNWALMGLGTRGGAKVRYTVAVCVRVCVCVCVQEGYSQ